MAVDLIQFDVALRTRELTEQGQLFYIEYFIVEANTRSQSVTLTVKLEDTDAVLPTFFTAERSFTQVRVDRLGPVSQVTFDPV